LDALFRSRLFRTLVYVLLVLFALDLLVRIRPILVWVFGFVKAVLAPFAAAMIVSYLLHPVVNLLSRRNVPRPAAVLLIYAAFVTTAAVALTRLVPVFVYQLRELNEHLPDLTFRAQSVLDGVRDERMPEAVRRAFDRAAGRLESALSERLADLASRLMGTVNWLFAASIVPFLAFYMLKDVRAIERAVFAFVPRSKRKQFLRLVGEIDAALGRYVRGQLVVCMIVATLAYIGYRAIGLPYALLLAGFVGIFNIIPYLGPFFGAIPALVVASTVSFKTMLFVVLINSACHLLESNWISPQIVGKSLHLHPLVILLAVLAGGELAGPIGMVLAVPVVAAGKVVLSHIGPIVRRNVT